MSYQLFDPGNVEKHVDLSNMTYYDFKMGEAVGLFKEAVIEEDGQQVIINASKLYECREICVTLTEQRARIPYDIQAFANYYLSIGRSDEVALNYLRMALTCCERFYSRTGKPVQGQQILMDAFRETFAATGTEQSDYGGIFVNAAEAAQRGRSEALLEARGPPTLKATAPSSSEESRRKNPAFRDKQARKESVSDEG